MSGMRVHSEEFGDIGFLSSVFFERVADERGKLWGGCEDHRFGRVDRAVECFVGDSEPKVAGTGDEDVYLVSFVYALKLNVVNI